MINRTVLTGRLVADPELRYSKSGVAVCNFTLAVNRPFDREKTDFIRCLCFKKTAENLAQYQKKGSMIGVDGRIQTGSYEKDGRTVYTTDIVADQVAFLESKGGGNNQSNTNTPNQQQNGSQGYGNNAQDININDDSLPF